MFIGGTKSVYWDYFTLAQGRREGVLQDLTEANCVVCTKDRIEQERWIRLLVQEKNLWFSLVGRVVLTENKLETADGYRFTLYRQEIQFMQVPNSLLLGVFASKQPRLRAVVNSSCRSLSFHDEAS